MILPQHSLRLKLMLGFVFACLAGLLAFALLVQHFTVASFQHTLTQNEFNRFVEAAERYYRERGSWEGLVREQRPQTPGPQTSQAPPLPRHIGIVDTEGRVVSRMDLFPVGSQPDFTASRYQQPITVHGQVVGTVFHDMTSEDDSWGQNARALVQTSNRTLFMAGGVGLVLAVLMGLFIARQLTRPLEQLTLAAGQLKFGKPQPPVPVLHEDEVGTLTCAFNAMGDALVKAEQQRRQMIADIAHDLGTPLTVASGYLQGMKQGKLHPTPERLEVVYDELLLLQNLVDDLRLLSLADAGMLTLSRDFTSPAHLLNSIHKAFSFRAEKQNVQLRVQLDEDLPEVQLDVERMRQVLGNLVNNALHYTPEHGEIRLVGRKVEGGVLLQVEDTGVGIPEEKLPFIFERFYRVDETRSPENGGGSGLGLAIARSIVELHGGHISAHSVLKHGTTISIFIPEHATATA